MSSNPGQMGAILKLQHEKMVLYFSGKTVQSYEIVHSSILLLLKRGSLSYSEEPSCEWHNDHRT